MMLPSSLPLVRIFAAASAAAPNRGRALAAFLGAYALVWTSFGMLAFAGDAGLHALVNASPWVEEHEWAIAPSVLMLAGAFQFTPLKDACLRSCRHPASFMHRHYRRGTTAAFRLGARHGVFCVGCCWALMLVMFAVGVANLIWMALLTAADGAREDPPPGRPHSAADRRDPAGAGLDTVPLGSIDLALAPGEIRRRSTSGSRAAGVYRSNQAAPGATRPPARTGARLAETAAHRARARVSSAPPDAPAPDERRESGRRTAGFRKT
jgi:hypothetical protein